jgi:hypothetical protein
MAREESHTEDTRKLARCKEMARFLLNQPLTAAGGLAWS